MGNYAIYRQGDGVCLSHAGMKTMPKTERPGHKWIARLLSKSGLRYIYSPEQLRSYYNAQRDAMKKGMKVITTQGQENTAKWKVDKKPTAENKNNYERAKAANNYAQRDYYDAKKASENGVFGKLSSALKPKPSENSQKSDQNGRSRGQSNMYVADKYGNTYRPGVIGDKPKGGMQSAEQGKEQSDKNDWKDNRPEGRKRNITGKAEPIEKGEGLGISGDDHANRANPDRNGTKAQEAIDQYVDKRSLLKDVEKRINTLINKDGIKPNENLELRELQKEKEKLEKECIGLLQDFHRYSAMSSDDAIANSIRKSSAKS